MSNLQNVHETPEQLVSSLNELLARLSLAIVIESPLDLTPSLLLAVLESILRARLPIPPALRESRDSASKVQAMKIFLGVLENDIIAMDVGLSDVDPRRLAAGEWDEVVFVGELLCWLGKKNGLLPPTLQSDVFSTPVKAADRREAEHHGHDHHRTTSPSTHSTTTNSHHSLLSMTRSVPGESDTTVMSAYSDGATHIPEPGPPDENAPFHSFDRPSGRHRPSCIHEVDDSSFVDGLDHSLDSEPSDFSASYCDCECSYVSDTHKPATTSSVRQPNSLDNDPEIRFFEAGRRSYNGRPNSSHTPTRPRASPSYSGRGSGSRTPEVSNSSGPKRLLTRHNSPTQYTLALLNERARLLTELANLSPTPKSS